MHVRNLGTMTLVVSVMVAIDALWNPVVLLSAHLTPALFLSVIAPNAATVDGLSILFKLATMVAFAVWIYLAGRNLVAAGFQELEFSPSARIWWFFVPIASLFKPFQGMRELWNASHDIWPYNTNDTVVSLWWALWLARSVVAIMLQISAKNGNGGGGGATVAISVVYIANAVIGIILIRRIAAAQRQLDASELGEVFA